MYKYELFIMYKHRAMFCCIFSAKGFACSCAPPVPPNPLLAASAYLFSQVIFYNNAVEETKGSIQYWLSDLEGLENNIATTKQEYKNRSEYSIYCSSEAEFALYSLDAFERYLSSRESSRRSLERAESYHAEYIATLRIYECLFNCMFRLWFYTEKADSV